MRTALLMAAAGLALLSASTVWAQATAGYDDKWYRAPFWSGEYPGGFSVVRTTTVNLRSTPDPSAAATIACELPQGATYQQWNHARVEEQALAFVSFTLIADYKMTRPLETSLYRRDDASEVKVSLKPGDTWRYLVYLAEGAFLMEYDGVLYDGNQDLFEHSEQMGDQSGYEEWMRINCANNRWGWLYMADIALEGGDFVSPNITGYGESKDLD